MHRRWCQQGQRQQDCPGWLLRAPLRERREDAAYAAHRRGDREGGPGDDKVDGDLRLRGQSIAVGPGR